MRIDPKSQIAGIPALRIRDFLRRVENIGWKVDFLQDTLKVSRSKANRIISELVERGYIREDERSKYKGYWQVSSHGNRFALATAAKSIRRSAAEKRLNELIDKAKQVNANNTYLYKVKKLGIFGSYLSNQGLINDIDIALVLEPKEKNIKRHKTLIWKKVAKAKKQGRQFANFSDELFWPQIEILNYLKSRSRALSLHLLSHIEFEALESKLVVDMTSNSLNKSNQASNTKR